MVWLFIILGMVGIFAATIIPMYLRMKQLKPVIDAAKQRFLDEVGYPFGGPQSLVVAGPAQKQLPQGTVTHQSDTYMDGNKQVTWQEWKLRPQQPLRVELEIVEKRLIGTLQKLQNLIGPTSRTVRPQLAGPHPIGDDALDARFALFSADPAAARAIVQQPALRQELLALKEVSLLRLSRDCVSFSDPSDANLWAAYSAAGLSRFAVNPAPMIEVSIGVHQSVRRLLLAAAAAAAAAA